MNFNGGYLSVIGLLIFTYLVVSHGQDATSVLNALSSANTSTIKALQGR